MCPVLTDERVLDIQGGRHPVVERERQPFIANDLQMHSGRKMLLITGPNMGGKSTYMRQCALIVLMAHLGAFVPAQAARLGAVDRIFTRIGASDDLAGGRSTFMVEMSEAAQILHQSGEQSLVLMDEIGRGTSTFDGLALAHAMAEALIQRNRAYTLFATHYFELTRLAQEHPALANVHLDAVEHRDRIVFLHHVEHGPASQSYGLQVAALAGVPEAVIRAAQRKLVALENQAAEQGPPDLFSTPAPAPEPAMPAPWQAAIEQLLALDLDALSPREAWQSLAQLQMQARQGRTQA